MQIPETIKTLPENCILISYDCEANNPGKPDFVPGSCMSIGAVHAHWNKDFNPFWFARQVDRTFFWTTQPEGPMPEKTKAFWAEHPQAHIWSTQQQEIPIAGGFHMFARWAVSLHLETRLPIVLVAAPHKYDVQHLLDGSSHISDNRDVKAFWEIVQFADSAELYATKHNLPLKEGKTEFKNLFMPKNLVHEPVLDSMVQLSATIAGLLYQRPPGPAVTNTP